ncbi:hypothetical protein HDU96_009522 [Phlyctochytrium bullatum]|nr:hypothetical protein HDU96_009522 [Phlyctochytrium bullatum]
MITAINDDFSWTEYGISKAISVGISIGSFGVGTIANKIGQKTEIAAKERVKLTAKKAFMNIAKVAGKEILKAGAKQVFNRGLEEALKAAFKNAQEAIASKLRSMYRVAMDSKCESLRSV